MSQENKDGQGVLAPNANRAHDRQPNWKGDVAWKGRTFQLAGWDKDKEGKKMISLSSSVAGAAPGSQGGKGYIIVNDARANDRQPQWRGRISLDGEELWLSGWDQPKDGQPVISIRATEGRANAVAAGEGVTTTPPPSASSSAPASSSPASSAPAAPAAGNGLPSDPFGDIFSPLG